MLWALVPEEGKSSKLEHCLKAAEEDGLDHPEVTWAAQSGHYGTYPNHVPHTLLRKVGCHECLLPPPIKIWLPMLDRQLYV